MRRSVLLGLATLLVTAGCVSPARVEVVASSPTSVEDPAPIVVRGLEPGASVTVRATTADREGRAWTSTAELTADAGGRVDTGTTASAGGTYTGVDVTGPYWSMQPPPEVPAAPYPFLDGPSADVEVEVRDAEAAVLARAVVPRPVGDPAAGVEVTPVVEGLVGDLYVPRGRPGPHPGVLLLGGSEGGRPDPAYATLLAAHGHVVLGLAYFGVPGRPPALSGIPVEYGLAAADRLAASPEVGGRPIAVHGTSKGAEYALLLAATAPDRFGAVVAAVPSDVVWPALAFGGGPTRSSWTRAGVDVQFVPPRPVPFAAPGPGGALRVAAAYTGWFDAATPAERAAARIPVERIRAPVLLISAGDDGIWPSQRQTERIAAALPTALVRHHPGAGHVVGGVPHLPATRSVTAAGPILLESGGLPLATAGARAASLRDVLALLGTL